MRGLHPGLQGRVVSINVVESSNQQMTILPTSGAVLGMQFRGRVQAEHGLLSTAGVTGIQQSARRYTYLGETGSVLVRFTAQGAACLGVPASDLTSESLALDDLLPPASVRRMHEQVTESSSPQERIAAVERFLLSLPYEEDPVVARGLALIETGDGSAPFVASMARELGLSERQLERRFLQRVGLTPKRYTALRRFERAVAAASTTSSLTDVALDAGYYDQAHFNREFRRLTGATPGAMLGRR
jgi:AraC-like DNA-binding protein